MEQEIIPPTDSEQPSEKGADLSQYVTDIFQEFKTGRQPYEDKAEEWWNNFLSQYQDSKTWRNKEGEGNRSRVFIKITQQKCYTAHAKVIDALGPDTPFDFQCLENLDYGNIPPEVLENAANYRKKYISEYLRFIKFSDTRDDAILDATIFPAAIIKGPILINVRQPVVKRRMINGIPAEELDPSMSPYMVTLENVEKYIFETVPFWDYYVDVNAKSPKDSVGEIHYKRMLPQEFRELADDPGYDRDQMKLAVAQIETIKSTIPDSDDDRTQLKLGDKFMGYEVIKDGRIPVLEFSGLVPVKMLKEFGANLPEGLDDEEDVEAIVACVLAGNNFIIKANFNYFGYRNFMVFGAKKIPNCVYKNSIAGLMDDSQMMINSGARMFVDNKALSGNGCLAIHDDKINWQKTGSATIYPRKTFYLKGNATVKDAIENLTFTDTTSGLREMIQFFLEMADNETGIPKYTQGTGEASYLNKTAQGISMIMGAANVNLKPFLANIDANVTEPVVMRMDALFSMLNKYPQEFNIPLKAVATGTISLIAKELIVENMIKFLQITQNPQDDMIIRRRELIIQMADKLGLSKFVRTEREIQQIEKMMAERQNQKQIEAKPEISLEKLFERLTPFEQGQVLMAAGVKPDPSRLLAPGQPVPIPQGSEGQQ